MPSLSYALKAASRACAPCRLADVPSDHVKNSFSVRVPLPSVSAASNHLRNSFSETLARILAGWKAQNSLKSSR